MTGFGNTAYATTVLPLTLGQLLRQSHVIFFGEVVNREVVERTDGTFWTHYQIVVDERWGGALVSKGHRVELTLQGGQIGEGIAARGQVIHGQPTLNVHQKGVFFLEKASTGRLVFTGLSQGWFALEHKADGTDWLKRDDVHTHLHKPLKVHALSTAPKSLDELPLTELKRLVTQGAAKPIPFSHSKPIQDQPLKLTPLQRRVR